MWKPSAFLLSLWIVPALCGPAAADDSALPYPHPSKENPREYLRAGQAFLEEHPESEYAPRVLMDLLIVAEPREGELASADQIDQIKRALLFRHPTSFEASYVAGTFKDAAAFRAFATELPDDVRDEVMRRYGELMYPLVRLGMREFGVKLFEDTPFTIKAALAAEAAGGEELRDQLLRRVASEESDDEPLKEVVRITFGEGRGSAGRVVALREVEGVEHEELVAFLTDYHLTRMNDSERDAPAIRRIRADRRLSKHEWAEALELLRALPTEEGAGRVAFQMAWCRMALGEWEEAMEQFERVEGAWAAPAAELAEALMTRGASFEQNIDVLMNAAAKARAGVEVFEATADYTTESGGELRFYVGIHSAENHMEAALFDGDRIAVGYRGTADSSRLYIDSGEDEPYILRSSGNGLVFTPNLNLEREENGEYTLNFGADVGDSMDEAAESVRALFGSEHFTTRTGLSRLLDGFFTEEGWCPAPVRSEDGLKVFAWLVPDMDEPELNRVEVFIDEDATIRRIRSRRLQVTSRYGRAGAVRLSPPAWPTEEVKTVSEKEMVMAIVGQLVPAVMELYMDE